MKIGIFGGVFNPFHKGHLASIKSILDYTDLDELRVIPCFQPVDKQISNDSPSPNQRLEILESELKPLMPKVKVDDIELKRGGRSYSVDTLKTYQLEEPEHEFYLIIGADQFEVFDSWKEYETILQRANLIVTSRPGWSLDDCFLSPPEGVTKLITTTDNYIINLKTTRTIEFVQVEEIKLSSSHIRQIKRVGASIQSYVSAFSDKYITNKKLYQNEVSYKLSEKDLADMPYIILDYFYKNSKSPAIGFDLKNSPDYSSEYTIIVEVSSTVTGNSEREKLENFLKDRFKILPSAKDFSGDWSILDYGYIMIHFITPLKKNEYELVEMFQGAELLKRKDLI